MTAVAGMNILFSLRGHRFALESKVSEKTRGHCLAAASRTCAAWETIVGFGVTVGITVGARVGLGPRVRGGQARDQQCCPRENGDEFDVDLTAGRVRNRTKNTEYAIPPFSPTIQAIIDAGGMVPFTRTRLGLSGNATIGVAFVSASAPLVESALAAVLQFVESIDEVEVYDLYREIETKGA